MNRTIYIVAAKQISIQQPLTEEWMTSPLTYDGGVAHAVEANYRDYLSPMAARRMAPIMKRALATALETMRQSGIGHPDAIMTGTSMGSLNHTEKFLDEMDRGGEQLLKPTYFMQSTHNTVGSMLGIQTKTHGYNTTYSHGAVSFELALRDAFIQMQLGRIASALVCGNDEMVDSYYALLAKTGYVGVAGMCPCGEVSVSMMATTTASDECLCQVAAVAVGHHPTVERVAASLRRMLSEACLVADDIDAVFTGVNGNTANDAPYQHAAQSLLPKTPLAGYKPLFGENYTSAALGIYAAACCIGRGFVPSFMYYANKPQQALPPRNILVFHQQEGKDYSLVLLRKT